MCVVCGCSNTGTSKPDSSPEVHPTTGDLHFGAGAARVSVPGLSQQRTIKIEEDVLAPTTPLPRTTARTLPRMACAR